LAEEYGCSVIQVKRHSARESWVAKRRDYRNRVESKTIRNAVETEATIRARHIETAKYVQFEAIRALRELDVVALAAKSPMVVPRLLQLGVEIERRALGLSDRTIDVRTLDTEIIETVAEIVGLSEDDVTLMLEDASEEASVSPE
jgi:hypothetical protein